MAPILSACLVMDRCGSEIDVALRCIQNADLEVSVFLCDNSPDELTVTGLDPDCVLVRCFAGW